MIVNRFGNKLSQIEKPETNGQQLSEAITQNNVKFLREAPEENRLEVICTLLTLGFELAKGLEGKAFVKLWIEDALEDLETSDDVGIVIK